MGLSEARRRGRGGRGELSTSLEKTNRHKGANKENTKGVQVGENGEEGKGVINNNSYGWMDIERENEHIEKGWR